ncbi:MAG: universal stress protein [Rubrivivax sp.]|nr:universal stress protein [Rubrivivax sp.]
MRHILVHIDDQPVGRHALELGAALAGRFDASLAALLVLPPAALGVTLSPEAAALAQQAEHAERARLREEAQALVADVAAGAGRAIALEVRAADVVDALLAQARTADLLLVGQRTPEGVGGLSTGQAGRLLVNAGGPVLTVPHIGWRGERGDAPPAEALQRALVAWADTRESTRALRDALPLLARAAEVEVVTFGGASEDAAEAARASLAAVSAHLARHGVAAKATLLAQREPTIGERLRRGWVPDVSVAEALLSHAADTQAQFIVMGGYGHARLRELMLGGVTRTMIETMTVPVLMAH